MYIYNTKECFIAEGEDDSGPSEPVSISYLGASDVSGSQTKISIEDFDLLKVCIQCNLLYALLLIILNCK